MAAAVIQDSPADDRDRRKASVSRQSLNGSKGAASKVDDAGLTVRFEFYASQGSLPHHRKPSQG